MITLHVVLRQPSTNLMRLGFSNGPRTYETSRGRCAATQAYGVVVRTGVCGVETVPPGLGPRQVFEGQCRRIVLEELLDFVEGVHGL